MKKTKRVRIRLDFVLVFKDELDSLPPAKPALLDEALAAWVRKMGLDSAAEELGPANIRLNLDFRSTS